MSNLYPHVCIQMVTPQFILSFKMILVYLQHNFHCLLIKLLIKQLQPSDHLLVSEQCEFYGI